MRHPPAYAQAIAQRQQRYKWPGLAATARSQPTDAPGRYALPAWLVVPRPPAPVEETPLLFRRVIDEQRRELDGHCFCLDLRRLTPVACDGGTGRIGVPEERLTACLEERAAPIMRRVEQRISQEQGRATCARRGLLTRAWGW